MALQSIPAYTYHLWSYLHPPGVVTPAGYPPDYRYQVPVVERFVFNPKNLHDQWGAFHRLETLKTPAVDDEPTTFRIYYHRADAGERPFVTEGFATPGPEDDFGCMFIDPRERLFILYQEGPDTGGNAVEVFSDSDGETWSDPLVAIPGGIRPAATVGADGTIYRCAVVDGEVWFTRQNPGDATPEEPFVILDDAEANILVEDDTIGLAEAHGEPAALVMSIVVQGETEVSDCQSWDDGLSWKRIT